MPQMAPLSWLTLMITFSLILIMFNVVNYYSLMYNIKTKKIEMTQKEKTWKW
uniref:ATP synthase complex subunit 8 n=1 Tax=Alleculinae sp. ALL01 TaxID=1205809 RepID=A0A0S2MR38_9CUCU|nr:ATP synthase F0 subunit 8 [Alleculinae sp. ALL01]